MPIIPDKAIDFLFPARCLACGKRGAFFCSSCLQKTKALSCQICPVCGKPSLGGRTHFSCQSRYSLDGLSSFFAYQLPLSLALKKAKYWPFVFSALKELVALVFSHIKEEDFLLLRRFLQKKPILVPIPLSRRRFFLRGYNQAAIMAEFLGQEWKLSVAVNLLFRIKDTRPQFSLGMRERQKNLRQAFIVNKDNPLFISGKGPLPPLLLVDDIWTTGATLRTAANVLKRAGFSYVWGLTLCR